MKSIIKKEKEEILKRLVKKIVAIKYIQNEVNKTPQEIKDIDIEKLSEQIERKKTSLEAPKIDKDIKNKLLEELQDMQEKRHGFDQLQQDLTDIEKLKEQVNGDVFSYNFLDEAGKEVNKLLCIK